MSLWNPRKPLNQPPRYGQITPQQEPPPPYDPLTQILRDAEFAAKAKRGRKSVVSVFDKSTKGSR